MAIKINNTTISLGNKVNYNGVQKTKVNYNGNEVYVYDNTGPIITVTSDSGYISSSTYTLEGIVTDLYSGIKSLKIDGVSVSISSSGAFSKTFTIDGQKTFTIVAVDNAENSSTVNHTVTLENTNPSLSITSASGYIASTTYTLSGVASDSQSGIASVTIDGVAVSVNSGGGFSKTFTVTGTKTFTVVAKDVAGNSRTVNHTVTLENTNPSLSITSASGYIASNSYTLTGVATDSQSGIASVTIDGVAVSVNSNGTFSKAFTISGTKTFTVVAKDKAGHSTTVTHSVTYDNSAHAATLTTSLITNIKYDSYSWASYEEAGGNSGSVVGNFYCSREHWSKCTGDGVEVTVIATYSGDIYLPALPNWNKIRKVVISRYGQGSQTFNPNGSQTTLSFSDSASESTTEHQVGHYADVGCKAGISSLTYYYA